MKKKTNLTKSQQEKFDKIVAAYKFIWKEEPTKELFYLYNYAGYEKLDEILTFLITKEMVKEKDIEKAKALGKYHPAAFLYWWVKHYDKEYHAKYMENDYNESIE